MVPVRVVAGRRIGALSFGMVGMVCGLLWFGSWQGEAAEELDRGLIAMQRQDGGVYVGWRSLAGDPAGMGFEVWRSASAEEAGERINREPITSSCNFIDDAAGNGRWHYRVRTSGGESTAAVVCEGGGEGRGYRGIKLQGDYRPQKVGVADLDGDGALDYVIKQPDFNTDPYQQPGYWKKSEDTYKIEAYGSDGRFRWRHDMGWAIEEGIWYSPMVVYDIDGDGKAEVMCKAGEGDPREPTGHVRGGPEYLLVLDGVTGKAKKRLPWPSREGFDDYNYYSRNLLGVAYLDGVRPFLIVERGTYRIIKVQALDPSFSQAWYWEASGPDASYRGQGMHGMHAADVDGDGKDEVVLGSAVLDHDGRALWNTRKGHPDVCYVADVDPARPGLEIFYGIEPGRKSNTVCLVEGKTGTQIWGSPEITVHVHGQGMVGDIDPEHAGMECYAGEAKGGTNYWLYSAAGERLSDKSLGDLSPKAVYWLDGPQKVYIVGTTIYQWPRRKVGTLEGRIVAIADCLGDWREEVITALNGEIRIYTTTVASTSRRTCLMQDRLYRTDVAMQTMGYFYAPQLGGYAVSGSASEGGGR